jgi:hypothetical protein
MKVGRIKFEVPLEWDEDRVVMDLRVQNIVLGNYLQASREFENIYANDREILNLDIASLATLMKQLQRICKLVNASMDVLTQHIRMVYIPELNDVYSLISMQFEAMQKKPIQAFVAYEKPVTIHTEDEVRRITCACMGMVYGILTNHFPAVRAVDPRNKGNHQFYYLEQESTAGEEASRLLEEILKVENAFNEHKSVKIALTDTGISIAMEQRLPSEEEWARIRSTMGIVEQELIPLIKNIMLIRSIRYDELVGFNNGLKQIPSFAEIQALQEQIQKTMQIIQNIPPETDDTDVHMAYVNRMRSEICSPLFEKLGGLLVAAGQMIDDMTHYISLWKQGVVQRRCLQFALKNNDRAVDED